MNIVPRRCVLRNVAAAMAIGSAGCALDPDIPGGRLYVENRDEEADRIELSVTDVTDGTNRLVNSAYRIPGETALQFQSVLQSGNSYDIRAYMPSAAERETLKAVIDT